MQTSLRVTTVAAALLAACSPGGSGDKLAPFQGSVLGDGRSLASLNERVHEDGSPNPPPAPDAVVRVTGARVTWVDQYDETRKGAVGNIYLQDFTDPPGPNQGILAFQSGFSPPSFRTSVGDVIDITGQYQEFHPSPALAGWTLPEAVGGQISLRFDAPYIPIVPVVIAVTDLNEYTTGRQWLSMVVTVENVSVLKAVTKPYVDKDGRTTVGLATGGGVDRPPLLSDELFDLGGYLAQVMKERGLTSLSGLTFASVTGVVTMFREMHIAPRSAADIVLQ